MANGSNNNAVNDPITRFYVALVIVAGGLLTGNGYLVRSATVEVDAPDRYTGTQGRALERRVGAIEKSQDALDAHLLNHPDHALRLLLSEALLRIKHLEAELEEIKAQRK